MHTYIYIHVYIYTYTHRAMRETLIISQIYVCTHWSKETPPPGGVFYLLCSLIKNLEGKDPPRKICTRCFEGGPLASGSWCENIVNRKTPRGGGFLLINMYLHICIYIYIHTRQAMRATGRRLLIIRQLYVCTHIYTYMYIYIYTHAPGDASDR